MGRLSLREDPSFDAVAFAAEQQAKVEPERRADVYAELARAAHEENRDKAATALWVEALNRRLERAWLREAAFAAERAGEGPSLLAFFERQRENPRDVRWAVAVRELRLQAGDAEGAIEAARAALAVRPDRESLWREAADLLVRAGRMDEATRLVADWQGSGPPTRRRPAGAPTSPLSGARARRRRQWSGRRSRRMRARRRSTTGGR